LKTNPLAVNLAGLNLANPVMLASGVLGLSREFFAEIAKNGAGAIVTKSIGLISRNGYPNPTVVQTNSGIINAMGLPNPGIDRFLEEIHDVKKLNVPIIVSIYGFSTQEFGEIAKKVFDFGADAVEINLSCPHVRSTGLELGQNPKLLQDVIRTVKNKVSIPVFVKLSPNVTDIGEMAEFSEKAGASAITAINTVKAMAIDPETGIPILGNQIGGLSGPAIKPIALRCVFEIYQRVNIPIIGCGGISVGSDAIEFLLAGASAVQIGTAISLKGLQVFKNITNYLSDYLERKKLLDLSEIVGLAHKCYENNH